MQLIKDGLEEMMLMLIIILISSLKNKYGTNERPGKRVKKINHFVIELEMEMLHMFHPKNK